MVGAESEVVLLPSFVFVSMLSIDDACDGASLWWLVLPDWGFFHYILRPVKVCVSRLFRLEGSMEIWHSLQRS